VRSVSIAQLLVWIFEHAEELGIDPSRIIVGGASAGGVLAAGIGLLARDRGGPQILAQWLTCPQLDHRNDSVSARQYTMRAG
jgi:acetyl esterase/lipase